MQNGHASLQSRFEETQQVWVADSGCHVHFTSKDTSVVVVDQLVVQTFCSHFKFRHFHYSPPAKSKSFFCDFQLVFLYFP